MRVARLRGPGAPALDALALLLGRVTVVSIEPPSEAQLRAALKQQACDVAVLSLSLAASGASYATAALADSQGQARKVNVQPLAQLLAQSGVRIAVLASDAAADVTRGVARTWVDKGLSAVVVLPPPGEASMALDSIVKALADGAAVGAAVDAANGVQPLGRKLALVGEATTTIAAAAAAPAPVSAPSVQSVACAAPSAAATALRTKRDAKRFDVFLCHNSADKPSVKLIGARLKAQGILPWLDEWELPPGQPWQALLEQQITSIGSAAVFIGASGISPWHQQEMRGFLSEFADRQVPVIPVLLPDAPKQPELPLFLRQMTWVDFRVADPDPLERLLWGITGQRPEQGRSL